jgi:hypothetical protein
MEPTLTETLETKEKFIPLLEHFVKKSIDEQYLNSNDPSSLSYPVFYEAFLPGVAERNANNIYEYSQSPIEKIFLSSLLLLFIKSGMPCLHITEPAPDVEAYMHYYRTNHLSIMQLIESYKEVSGDIELERFDEALLEKKRTGAFTGDQVTEIQVHHSIIRHFEWNSYHLVVQAGFPHIKVNGRSIRCDLLIWVPGDENVKIIVECDGFAFHNSKNSFENDRARDRQLQLHGYRVIRFPGSEINRDPSKVSSELFDLLEALDQDHRKSRVL